MKGFIWILRIVASVILFQTLFFKFTGAPETIYLFEKLGLGDFGRIGSGIVELIIGILLLTPAYTKIGSLGAMAFMTGAIISHFTILGIEVQNDGGFLFSLAVTVLVTAALNFFLTKKEAKI